MNGDPWAGCPRSPPPLPFQILGGRAFAPEPPLRSDYAHAPSQAVLGLKSGDPYRELAALGQTVLVAPEGEGLRDVGPGPAELDGQLLNRSR